MTGVYLGAGLVALILVLALYGLFALLGIILAAWVWLAVAFVVALVCSIAASVMS